MTVALDFDLPPIQAIEFFRAKGLQPSFDWRDMLREEHDASFTVAKMMDLDLLRDMRDAVDSAIADGISFRDFRGQIEQTLMDRGWWGRGIMTDPLTGEERAVQLGSVRRLEVIYETNLRTSYAAGHWQQISDQAEEAPYLMYDAVDDGRVRPEHAQWSGRVFRVDDPFWDEWYPPNGWGCRCSVIQLTDADLRAMGLTAPEPSPTPQRHEWVNPRTGEIDQVPDGVDPGWNYHPGKQRTASLREQLREKAVDVGLDVADVALQMANRHARRLLDEPDSL